MDQIHRPGRLHSPPGMSDTIQGGPMLGRGPTLIHSTSPSQQDVAASAQMTGAVLHSDGCQTMTGIEVCIAVPTQPVSSAFAQEILEAVSSQKPMMLSTAATTSRTRLQYLTLGLEEWVRQIDVMERLGMRNGDWKQYSDRATKHTPAAVRALADFEEEFEGWGIGLEFV